MARRMIRVEEPGYYGWGCEDCGWLCPNPEPVPFLLQPGVITQELMDADMKQVMQHFDNHICKNHPLRKPPSIQT